MGMFLLFNLPDGERGLLDCAFVGEVRRLLSVSLCLLLNLAVLLLYLCRVCGMFCMGCQFWSNNFILSCQLLSIIMFSVGVVLLITLL